MRVWSHGYNVEVPYTYGYYKETSPLWIKWATYLGGRKPPKAEKIRVLELGCGQGFNLCMHASAFPEMEFLGIDFNPSQIYHAQELARLTGLKNVNFIEGDFVELSKDWRLGEFDYVILHGIWTWIAKPVRAAVVEILKKALLPGGLVYISYNSMPGWLPGTLVREVLLNYYKTSQKPAIQAVQEGLNILKRLEEFNAPIFRVYPNLKVRIDKASQHDFHYVVHEYLHDSHTIFWVYDVIEEVMPAKLYYIASANLPDNYLPALMQDKIRDFINEFSHPVFRLFLIDLFINQGFRRDIYQKGEVRPFGIEQIKEIREVKFISIADTPQEFKFQVGMGEIEGKKEVYIPLMEELSKKECSVEELLKIEPFNKTGFIPLIQALTLLMSKDLITLYNEQQDVAYTQRFNSAIIKAVSEGRPYNFLMSPLSATGVVMPPVEINMLQNLSEGVSTIDDLGIKTINRLNQMGRQIIKDGKPIENPVEAADYMRQLAGEFINKKLPLLKRLKVIP